MKSRRKHKCCHCKQFYRPDPRNGHRQRYCSMPDCRKASKEQSQRRWLQKPDNQSYFKSPENTLRVQEWRKRNPGYRRNKKPEPPEPLQEACDAQPTGGVELTNAAAPPALQDVLFLQPAVLVGLIATMTGFALQEDIVGAARRLLRKGQDILGSAPSVPTNLSCNEDQTSAFPSTAAARAAPI